MYKFRSADRRTGKIIEVHESHLTMRKFNRGRIPWNEEKKIWVYGGIETEKRKILYCAGSLQRKRNSGEPDHMFYPSEHLDCI